MKRRSKASSKLKKKPGHKPAARKRHDTARQSSSTADQKTGLAVLTRERDEALEREAATAEILKLISSSPTDTQPVFEAIVQSGLRLFPDAAILIALPDGNKLQAAALAERDPARAKALLSRWPISLTRQYIHAVAILDRRIIDISDARKAPPEFATGAQYFLTTGYRAITIMPMMRGDEAIGALSVVRSAPGALSDEQIAVLRTFASQAVIAIENARLLNELRQSLQQQTATADVLKVISRSTFDLQSVLDTLVQSATSLCEAECAFVFRREGDEYWPVYRLVASHGFEMEYADYIKANPIIPGRTTLVGRTALEGRTVHIPDVLADPEYGWAESIKRGNFRTMLGVPLLREGQPIGVIALTRSQVRPFSETQIALVTTFADQAVIAIENVRLFEAEQQRSRELSESLEQQTATSEVLSVISSSPGRLEPVFQSMLDNAVRICEAKFGFMNRYESNTWRIIAVHGAVPAYTEFLQEHGYKRPGPETVVSRIAATMQLVHIADLATSRGYAERDPVVVAAVELGGVRTMLGVPMLKEGELIGAILLYRQEVRPFTDKQVALIKSFADQAVIAIENVRLFEEIQDKSRQVEEASKHKSQFLANMSHELRTPLNAILGYAELVLDGIYGDAPEKMRNVLERIQTNGKHLLGLINDVLDLSKIEAGQLVLSLNDYSIKDMMQGVYVAVEPLAGNKKLNFKLEVPPNLPPARGDERRLSQVLLNLVGNAIKFTDTGEVAMKASSANGSYTIAVTDTGPGIAEGDQAKIFEEFQQSESTHTKAKGGTGLGLAIAKQIVEMHGGRLWVESALGSGSTFFFTVPLRVEHQAGKT
jgi:signal transduction histidine kinase